MNGVRVTKAGHGVKTGDVLSFARGRRAVVVEVLAFAERRGAAVDAAGLYREIPEPGEAKDTGASHKPGPASGPSAPSAADDPAPPDA